MTKILNSIALKYKSVDKWLNTHQGYYFDAMKFRVLIKIEFLLLYLKEGCHD